MVADSNFLKWNSIQPFRIGRRNKRLWMIIRMAKYLVCCGAFAIYAGTLNSKNKSLWNNKTECTDEALCAVRDYMVQELLDGVGCAKATSGGYEWKLKDGRSVELRVTIKNKN